MQGYTYGAHISHSGAQQDPAKKGLAGLRATGYRQGQLPTSDSWKETAPVRLLHTSGFVTPFSTFSERQLRGPSPSQ